MATPMVPFSPGVQSPTAADASPDAAGVAVSLPLLQAVELIFLTDVPGVRHGDRVLPQLAVTHGAQAGLERLFCIH